MAIDAHSRARPGFDAQAATGIEQAVGQGNRPGAVGPDVVARHHSTESEPATPRVTFPDTRFRSA